MSTGTGQAGTVGKVGRTCISMAYLQISFFVADLSVNNIYGRVALSYTKEMLVYTNLYFTVRNKLPLCSILQHWLTERVWNKGKLNTYI